MLKAPYAGQPPQHRSETERTAEVGHFRVAWLVFSTTKRLASAHLAARW